MSDAGGLARRRYLLDENVARSVAVMLRGVGREVFESRAIVGPQAADRVVEFVAAKNGLTLLSHDRDFKAFRQQAVGRDVRRTTPTIWIRVNEVVASARLAQCLSMIEEILDHAGQMMWDIEYVSVTGTDVNVKYRFVAPE